MILSVLGPLSGALLATALDVSRARHMHVSRDQARLRESLADVDPFIVELGEVFGLVLDEDSCRRSDDATHVTIRLTEPKRDARTLSEDIAKRSFESEHKRIVRVEGDVARRNPEFSHPITSYLARSTPSAGVVLTVEGSTVDVASIITSGSMSR